MTDSLPLSFFKDALIVLTAAGIVIPIFHRFRVSPTLGFMLVGLAVGPSGFGAFADREPWIAAVTISDRHAIERLAELGVVFLLFMIGLELSFERIKIMRREVLGLGALQLAVSGVAIGGFVAATGYKTPAAVVVGLALAMSSTAVVVQILSEERRMSSYVGRTSFAILLLQDLAAVPALFVIGLLGAQATEIDASRLAVTVGQSVLVVAAIVGVGRLALNPIFRSVARTRQPELFTAACLLVVLATGLATASVGMSMALGGLIAGLLLAETEYRRQVEVFVEPFKGLLLGLFLMSVGMNLDIERIAAAPGEVLAASAGLIAFKVAVIVVLARAFGGGWIPAVQVGLLLGPAGEFGFVILGLGRSLNVMPHDLVEFALVVSALTMATIPILAKVGQGVASWALRDASVAVTDVADVPDISHGDEPRVILAGYGRVGRTVGALLERHGISHVAIDNDADRVGRERLRGKPIYFGDMTRTDILDRLHLDTARALVVTIDDGAVAERLVAAARARRAELLIIVRARDAAHASLLYGIGATDAVPETVEASLQVAEAVLVDLGIAMGEIVVSIHETRAELQAEIKSGRPARRGALGAGWRPRSKPNAGNAASEKKD